MANNIYLLGYRAGYNDYSWSDTFFSKDLPVDIKLNLAQIKGYWWSNKPPEKCDYYIARSFG